MWLGGVGGGVKCVSMGRVCEGWHEISWSTATWILGNIQERLDMKQMSNPSTEEMDFFKIDDDDG